MRLGRNLTIYLNFKIQRNFKDIIIYSMWHLLQKWNKWSDLGFLVPKALEKILTMFMRGCVILSLIPLGLWKKLQQEWQGDFIQNTNWPGAISVISNLIWYWVLNCEFDSWFWIKVFLRYSSTENEPCAAGFNVVKCCINKVWNEMVQLH